MAQFPMQRSSWTRHRRPAERRSAPGLRRAAVWVTVAGLLGLAEPACRPVRPPLIKAPAASLLQQLAAERERVGPLTATFDATLKRSGPWFNTGSVSGVLALQPPDRFRIKLFLPGGLTVQDLTLVGDSYRLVLPLEGRERRGQMCFGSAAECEDAGPGLVLGWIFTRDVAAHAATSTVVTSGDRRIIATGLVPAHDLHARLTVARDELRVLREELFQGGQLWLRAEFDDYRLAGGRTGSVALPYSVRVADERNKFRIDLRIRSYALKDGFPDGLFVVE